MIGSRRWLVAPAALLAIIFMSTGPAGATRYAAPDPTGLALPVSTLPPGTTVVYSAVSDNNDADNAAQNPIKALHQQKYADLGRTTGYREELKYVVGTSPYAAQVTTEYFASIFTSAQSARAALDDATKAPSIISIIGKPLSPGCDFGETCLAYTGVTGANTIVFGIFVRGPVLVEIAESLSSSDYVNVEVAARDTLYSLLKAADGQAQSLSSTQNGPTSTVQPSPVASPTASPIASPVASATPSPTSVINRIPPRTLGRSYIAFGDSYSSGYLTQLVPYDLQCQKPDAPGFVCVFLRFLREIKPALAFHNFSEPGADSCELAGAGHRCYDTKTRTNPLDAGITYLKTHPGQVSPITVTIGGNDLLALVTQALTDPAGAISLIAPVYPRYRSNLDTILRRIRTAAPRATIILTTQPNPLGGVGSPPLPGGFPSVGKNALQSLNKIMKDEAAKYGAVVADTASTFDAYPGGGSALSYFLQYLPQGRVEIHPTPKGYHVYGEALIAQSGYKLKVSSHLTSTVKAGGTQHVKGTTGPKLTIRVTVRLPDGTMKLYKSTAGPGGKYSDAFRVGTRTGRGSARVCVFDPDKHSACTATLAFTIR